MNAHYSGRLPYWRLSGFYFCYFASVAALVPFWGLYLQHQGYTPLAIGQLMAIPMATKIVAPNVWAWIADRNGQRMYWVRWAAFLSMLTFLLMFQTAGFWELALVMALFSFFWNASLPQVEAVTFNHLQTQARRYAGIRLWGSVGFIVTVIGLGEALETASSGIIPQVVWLWYVGIWLVSLLVPEARIMVLPTPPAAGLSCLLRQREIQAFFIACACMQISHGPYYAFYSIYLQEYGYTKTFIGSLWALGVGVEVLLFLMMHRLLYRYSARRVLITSIGLAVIRWLLVGGFPQVLSLLIFAQLLHAATFGAFHAAAIHLVHHYFTGPVQGRGQALYNSLGFGAGGALGSLGSGYLWSHAGAAVTFAIAALTAVIGGVVAWQWVDRTHRY